MLLYRVSFLFTAGFSLLLGLYVFSKSPSHRSNQTWALTCIAVSIWSVFYVLGAFSANKLVAIDSFKISNVTASFIPVFFTHFCQTLVDPRVIFRRVVWLGYAVSGIILLFSLTDSFIIDAAPISIFNFYPRPGPVYYLFTLHFFFFMVFAEITLLHGIRSSKSPYKRTQLKYVTVGTTCGFIAGATTFLPVFGVSINPFAAHFIWLYAALISYAIIRHQLLDIAIIFKKGVTYALLITLLTLAYFAVIFVLSILFQRAMGFRSVIASFVAISLISICFKPLERLLNNFIDRFVFHRTPEFLEEENKKLMAQVAQQNRMKATATLAAGMAHEIRNPLTTIKVFVQYLKDKYDDTEFREKFLRIVPGEVDRMNNLIGQLLNFAKPRTPVLMPEAVEAVMDETIDFLSNDLLKSGVHVVKNYGRTSSVPIDRQQFKQVFLNLFLNSIQAMPTGGKLILSTSLDSDRRAQSIVIQIQDTGHGIPKEHLAHIFEPFYTTKTDSGSGLGLAIVYGIIKEHGGTIQAKSIPNQTTAFTIRIPIFRLNPRNGSTTESL